MAIEFVLPVIASLLQGAAAGGLHAFQSGRQANEDRRLAGIRRAELQPIIDNLRKSRDWFQVEENLARNFSRSADQMAAEGAQTGMTGAGRGGLDQRRGDVLGELIASLSEAQMQDDRQRQAMLAELLSDPTLYAGQADQRNIGLESILGALTGGAAGLGSILPAFLSTPEGLDVLRGLGGGKEPPANPDVNWWTDNLTGAGTRSTSSTRSAPSTRPAYLGSLYNNHPSGVRAPQ